MSSVYNFCCFSLGSLMLLLLIGTSPAEAKACLDCHAETLRQLKSNSHHIQGVEPDGRHCYACHWEAAADGSINDRFHMAENPKVNLVLWEDGSRPTEYHPETTAVSFSPAAIGTGQERREIAVITRHCLTCHNDTSSRSITFADDPNSPTKYAWDRESIDSRYSRKETTNWGKYSTAATNKKQRITKAFSAHGNAAANQGGWRDAVGYDGDTPLTRGGSNASNVECYDCHNSHGSAIAGVTSSYPSLQNSNNGGILKQTTAGSGGYRVNYQPSVNSYGKSINPFNSGAGLCFDCHESANSITTPWGYNSTFGLLQPVMGYKDTPGFGPGVKGSSGRFANRQGRDDIVSSHLKVGTPLHHQPNEQINGLCTPCHDPHGISRTLGDKMTYAVPLLKGSWLTSPYREDGPPTGFTGRRGSGIPSKQSFNTVNRDAGSNFAKADSSVPRSDSYNAVNRDAGSNFAKADSSVPRSDSYNAVNRDAGSNFVIAENTTPREMDANRGNRDANSNFSKSGMGSPREPMQGMKYNVDRNTFGGERHISEEDALFAGLCLKCHAKENLTGQNAAGLVHRTVKGWGNNREHAFPCSKCHQAHNSGLPRLMQTNCFEQGPSGLRESSGIAWLPYTKDEPANVKKTVSKKSAVQSNKIVGCHVKQFGKAAAGGKKDENWKEVAPW